MSKKIAILAGDGIGPEVMKQAIKVLQVLEKKFDHSFSFQECLVGGSAIEKFNEPLPAQTLKICQESEAILFGSVGGPRWDNLPKGKDPIWGALLPLRKHFKFFANIRPASMLPMMADSSPLKKEIIKDGFDFTIVRELTGGIYFGEKGGDGENEAFDVMKYQKQEIERIARLAFKMAQNSKGKVTSVDKANVLRTSVLWRKIVERIHKEEFSKIELEHLYIDNASMQILIRPQDFDIILTANMFGDILSDEAAQISGSLGMQSSASLNEKGFGMFEPSGGSAPSIAGKNIANPIAQIGCVVLMLEYCFNFLQEAAVIKKAVLKTLEQYRTADIHSIEYKKIGTEEMGDRIAENILRI